VSAALQLSSVFAAEAVAPRWRIVSSEGRSSSHVATLQGSGSGIEAVPDASLAFYRKHTEKMLRRYLYASMLVGRAPAILGEPVGRGWVSSRKVKTFEDAVIFVLDIERCLDRLEPLDRALLSRIVLQEYTHSETAALLGMSVRTISYKYPQALDRMTEMLLRSGLLILPPS
jgi:hypothetical protein